MISTTLPTSLASAVCRKLIARCVGAPGMTKGVMAIGARRRHSGFRVNPEPGRRWRISSNVGGVMLDGRGIPPSLARRAVQGRHKIWLRCFDQSTRSCAQAHQSVRRRKRRQFKVQPKAGR